MYGLTLNWHRCDDGVELVDYGDDYSRVRRPVSREEFDQKIESLEFRPDLDAQKRDAIIDRIYESQAWRTQTLDAFERLTHDLLNSDDEPLVLSDAKLKVFRIYSQVIGRLVQTGVWIRHASSRVSSIRIDLPNLEDPLVIRFVNARSDEALIQFCSRFGIPTWRQEKEEAGTKIVGHQKSLENLLVLAGGVDRKEAVNAANRGMALFASRGLTPQLDGLGQSGALRLALTPDSPLVFMTMECAMVAHSGARLARCAHCENVFLTGPMTGRRSSAQYCSDRCRVAAARARAASKS
jgi:hypothetical protein